ncbi:MAG TPA: FkbM family methyltransferase [Candidatus Acidoferrales bacterium]|nr:FkbM family methyltransferase [Candidatus Acidoferrales bacterium]
MAAEILKSVIRTTVPRPVRNWLRSPSRSAIWLWDAAAFSFGAKRTLSLFPDWSLVCHPHFYKVVQHGQIADPQQAEEFRNFAGHCSAGMFLFDIGAHFGIFSLAAAHFGGRAVAVDPSPTATKMIATEARLNGCSNSVQILQAAVSDTNGQIGMLNSGVFSDGYFQFADARSRSDLTRTQAVTVDQMSLQYGIPTHLKIDVEGHEAAVLRGAHSTLAEASPVLFLELHNEIVAAGGGDPASTLDEIAKLGYETFGIGGKPISRQEILRATILRIVAIRKGSNASG